MLEIGQQPSLSLGGGLVIIMFRIQLDNRFICCDTAAELNDMEQSEQYTIPWTGETR